MQRNSCAAIVAGCLQALERDQDSIVLVLAADHAIKDQDSFEKTIQSAIEATNQGHLITFGIKPEYPATGYGYILPNDKTLAEGGSEVLSFVEKPDAMLAQKYLEEGYLWNSGNFMFRADSFLDEAKALAPDVVKAVSNAHENKKADLDFLRLDETSFAWRCHRQKRQ